MAGDLCIDCVFYADEESGQMQIGPTSERFKFHGACLKRAPIGVITNTMHEPQEGEEYVVAAWPLVYEHWWCGDFNRKAKAPADSAQ
jgi:hypothetical protein